MGGEGKRPKNGREERFDRGEWTRKEKPPGWESLLKYVLRKSELGF